MSTANVLTDRQTTNLSLFFNRKFVELVSLQLNVPHGVHRGGAVPVPTVPIRSRGPVVAVHHRKLDCVTVGVAVGVTVAVLRYRQALPASRLSRPEQSNHRPEVSHFVAQSG
jgi:hypothetical protein